MKVKELKELLEDKYDDYQITFDCPDGYRDFIGAVQVDVVDEHFELISGSKIHYNIHNWPQSEIESCLYFDNSCKGENA